MIPSPSGKGPALKNPELKTSTLQDSAPKKPASNKPAHKESVSSALEQDRRKPRSARLSIVLWIVGTVALVLFAVILTTRTMLLASVEDRANGAVVQETQEFTTFLQQGQDPETAEPFTSTQRLFAVYLSRQIPDANEMLVGVVGGQAVQIDRAQQGEQAQWHAQAIESIQGNPEKSGVLHTAGGERIHWGRVNLKNPDSNPDQADAFIVAINISPEMQQVAGEVRTISYVAMGGLLGTLLIAWVIAGQILNPVRQLRHVASRITETDLTTRVPVAGTDENRELAKAFNAMLDRIEEVYDKQSRFVDDAGHELRTPITVIRGQLELLEQADDAQRARSVALTITELDRMTRIVNELLTLAVTDRADFLQPQAVDVSSLTIMLEDKAQVLATRDWRVENIAETTAMLDEQRITQAMLEFMSNAARHTNEGDRIEIGSQIERDADATQFVNFFVKDSGPGIPEDRLPQVFERFTRFSRQRDADMKRQGAGLGLSIVKAIAEAHGGVAWVESEVGSHSTFGIRIPLTPPEGSASLSGDTRSASENEKETETAPQTVLTDTIEMSTRRMDKS